MPRQHAVAFMYLWPRMCALGPVSDAAPAALFVVPTRTGLQEGGLPVLARASLAADDIYMHRPSAEELLDAKVNPAKLYDVERDLYQDLRTILQTQTLNRYITDISGVPIARLGEAVVDIRAKAKARVPTAQSLSRHGGVHFHSRHPLFRIHMLDNTTHWPLVASAMHFKVSLGEMHHTAPILHSPTTPFCRLPTTLQASFRGYIGVNTNHGAIIIDGAAIMIRSLDGCARSVDRHPADRWDSPRLCYLSNSTSGPASAPLTSAALC